jgi:hypothetical protein
MPGRLAGLLMIALLSGCAVFGGPAYTPGVTTQSEVLSRKGPPAHFWEEPDGATRLFWPTGPMGTSTIMARFDAKQRLISYEEVLNTEHFAGIQPGMSMAEVTRLIGPPYPGWTTYFKARDELAWEWRYCDSWNQAARFNVLFDGTTKKVRSTLSLTESQRFGGRSGPSCGHVYIPPAKPAMPQNAP